MSELKIYTKTRESNLQGGALDLNPVIEQARAAQLGEAKYKVMWWLRKIENQYRETNGFIILDIEDGELKAEGHNFPKYMADALRFLIPDIVFYNEQPV